MKMSKIAKMRYHLRQDVKRFGRAKARARAQHFISSMDKYSSDHEYVQDYRQACRDVLGGEW